MPPDSSLAEFHPVVRDWFLRTYGAPSPPQALGWPSISAGRNTLILAPTGSGKTLAAFLWAINHIVEQHLSDALLPGVRILYVSPLKALNNDIERNLRSPLAGIREEAERRGLRLPPLRADVRTGDTPAARRAAMVRHPPDILITTPESLYIMLTAKGSRGIFRSVQYVIVDEIHSICGNKRGVHLAVTLERLQEVAEVELVRIGLSATQRPLDRVAAFLGGITEDKGTPRPRPVTIIDAGQRKDMDLRVECATPDFGTMPQEGVWSLVFAELLALIRLHRTTLIFVNNRRLAERVAARLTRMIVEDREAARGSQRSRAELPPAGNVNLHAVPEPTGWGVDEPPAVRAYHGSMSRQARQHMESALKEGRLRALVATSSLELGIDIGTIDLVVQLQSPKGIAHGLQRVGRSGHLVTATSKGRIFATHREDLVEAAVIAQGMRLHGVEETEIPENCLDVLAQQIVAMASVEPQALDPLYNLIRRAHPYRTLPRNLFDGVVQMLAGRYASGALRELRPKISWDRVNGVVRALPGTSLLAITGGGTIADRGYYGVYLSDGRTKVGEVDEEFVFETRIGDTFILGTSVWRVDAMDANRVTVSPAPGQPARMPFWKGEGIGRSYELGVKIGEFRRRLSTMIDDPSCLTALRQEYALDSRGAWNIREYMRKQRESTGVIPSDRLVLVEGSRDELGDPRLLIHSVFGRRINGLLGLVLAQRIISRTGVEPQMLYNDDGILIRCADLGSLPLDILLSLSVEEAKGIALDGLLTSPLFGGQFRQNAGRALLMPRGTPGRRTPLWLQRLRGSDLLEIARRYDDFPIVIETVREILHDVLDFDHFLEVIRGLERGTIAVTTVQTEVPSPFSASLLFDFIAAYMYEQDRPRGESLSQVLAVNRELLAEIMDLETLPSLIRPEAIEEVEAQLQHRAAGTRARSPEELMEILLRAGDLSEQEILDRCEGDGLAMLRALEVDGRAVRMSFPDGDRWVAGEVAEVFRSLNRDEHDRTVIGRYLASRGPVTLSEIASRYDTPRERVEEILRSLEQSREVIRGRFRNSGATDTEPEWCSRRAVEQMHRRTITIFRREITPCSGPELTRFLLAWHGVGAQRVEPATLIGKLQGLPLPAEIWERDILRTRATDTGPNLLVAMGSSGSIVWVGTPGGRIMCLLRGNGQLFSRTEDSGTDDLRGGASQVLTFLASHGASFLSDIRGETGLSLASLNAAIARLFWGGFITNDVFMELTAVKQPSGSDDDASVERIELVDPRHAPDRGRIMQSARRALRQVPGWSGRWSLVRTPAVLGPPVSLEEKAQAQAEQLLERYGVLAREFHRREALLPWPFIAARLAEMELRGEVRRGYFVEGLSGMQYALPSAVELLRRVRGIGADTGEVVLLNACDPANPYGTGADLTPGGGADPPLRPVRVPGTYIAFSAGRPVIVVESYGSRIRTVGSAPEETLRAALERFVDMLRLPERLRPFRKIVIEYCDDIRPAASPLSDILRSLGFVGDRNQTMCRDAYG
ncbi:MAG: DEAD/DEAH box helicase [Bacteroidota bacterium]